MTRKLEIDIDARWLSSGKHYFPLPEGWDSMSPDEQRSIIDTYTAEIVRNRVTGTGRAVESRQPGVDPGAARRIAPPDE